VTFCEAGGVRLALMSDVHGNATALRAVLAAAAALDIDERTVLPGHHVEHRLVDYDLDEVLRRID
jgi:hypothetical protein